MTALLIIGGLLAAAGVALLALGFFCAWVSGEMREAGERKRLGADYEGPAAD
ncbi:MAG: hypothetical protein JNK23_10475 [Opitutaceae bacterium]|nr:hypothetical protein [Opitutaceae bacterium]